MRTCLGAGDAPVGQCRAVADSVRRVGHSAFGRHRYNAYASRGRATSRGCSWCERPRAPWSVPSRPTTVEFAKRTCKIFIGRAWMTLCPGMATGSCNRASAGREQHARRHAPVGFVKDRQDIFDRVRLAVYPLCYGAGLKGKDQTRNTSPAPASPILRRSFCRSLARGAGEVFRV